MARNVARCGRARWRDDRGNAIVEFAILTPVLFLILFGVIDFGYSLNDYNAIRQGVREGARTAVVGKVGSTESCNLHAAGGNATTRKIMCQTKSRIGTGTDGLYTKILFDGSYAVNNGLIVCAQQQMASLTGAFTSMLSGKWMRSKVQMNIEELTTETSPTAGEETLPAGASWSWCAVDSASP